MSVEESFKAQNYITYCRGNIFDYIPENDKVVVLPHVMNNLGGWGAGFTGPLGKKYPHVEKSWREWFLGTKPQIGEVQCVKAEEDLYIMNMIAQESYKSLTNQRPLNYEYLYQCMSQVKNFVLNGQKNDSKPWEIHTVKFGAGLGGGSWRVIAAMIDDLWVKNDISTTVYVI